MAEVGCLKDGNFQNLEVTSTFMQGGNAFKVAGYQLITTTADAETTAGSALTPNGIHFLAVDAAGDVGTNNETITLPAAGVGLNIGDFFTFVVVRASTHATGFTITTATADKIVGVCELRSVAATAIVADATARGGASTAVTNNLDLVGDISAAGVNSIVLDGGSGANVAGAAGTQITLTYVGNPDALGANAMYYVSGIITSVDPNGTGATTFA
jgi:hypothetical protein